MIQKKLFTKLLLVAAMLGVGTSAWAVITPVSQDYEGDGVSADWTSGSTGRYTVSIKTADTNHYIGVDAVGNGNNGTTITGTTLSGKVAAGDDFATSDDFTLIFDLFLNGGSNQSSSFFIYSAANSEATAMLGLSQDGTSTTWKVNGASDKTVTLAKNTWYTFQLSKSGSLLYLTVTPTAGGDAVFAQQTIAILSEKGGLGNMIFNTKRYYAGMGIDNVELRALQDGDVPAGTATSCTIKYRNESDVEIASDVTIDGLVDDVVTASAAQMADIVYNAKKYIYKSGNTDVTLVADAASNVITLVYREAETYTYRLTSDCLGTIFANSSDFEGNAVYIPYPKYELKDGTLYLAANGNSGDYFRDKYILTTNVDETKAYSATAIENVVFYVEGENISGASINNNERAADTRNSNGATGYAAGTAGEDDLTITTLAPGKYQIVANLHTSTSAGGTSTFKLGANTFNAVGNASQPNTEKTSDEFTIYESTALILQAGGGKTNSVDYVYVIRTGDATVSKTITSAGWATYCSPYALDFTNDIANLDDAFIVEGGSAGVLTKTSVKGGTVPANTGLLLKGNGDCAIPVAASSSTDVSANKFVGVTADTPIDADAGYVLMNDATNGLAFYKNNKAFTVGANTAYLPANFDGSGARAFFMLFDDDMQTTGVNDVRSKMADVRGDFFDLQGRKVANPTKGLYIVNGKKVAIK